jgi:hypothetical protein
MSSVPSIPSAQQIIDAGTNSAGVVLSNCLQTHPHKPGYCTHTYQKRVANQVGDSVAELYLNNGIPMLNNGSIEAARKAHDAITQCNFSKVSNREDAKRVAEHCLRQSFK